MFKVQTAKGASAPAPAAGMGRLIFVETLDGIHSKPTVRYAVDGTWVAATAGNSYAAVDVTPGSHTVCASRQGKSHEEMSNAGSMSVSVASGETQYAQFTLTRSETGDAQQHQTGFATQNTPDFTAKGHDYADEASFAAIKDDKATSLISKLPLATSNAPHRASYSVSPGVSLGLILCSLLSYGWPFANACSSCAS